MPLVRLRKRLVTRPLLLASGLWQRNWRNRRAPLVQLPDLFRASDKGEINGWESDFDGQESEGGRRGL